MCSFALFFFEIYHIRSISLFLVTISWKKHYETFVHIFYPLPALLTPFHKTFIIKDNANNGRNPPSCLFPIIAFINEEDTGCINKEVIGAINETTTSAIIASRNLRSGFIYFIFFISFICYRQSCFSCQFRQNIFKQRNIKV